MGATIHDLDTYARLGSTVTEKGVFVSSVAAGLRVYIDRELGDEWGFSARGPFHTKAKPRISINKGGGRCLIIKPIPKAEIIDRGKGNGTRTRGVGTFVKESGNQYRYNVPRSKGMYVHIDKCELPAERLSTGELMIALPHYFKRMPGIFMELGQHDNDDDREESAHEIKQTKKKSKTKKRAATKGDTIQTLDSSARHMIIFGVYRIICEPRRKPEIYRSED